MLRQMEAEDFRVGRRHHRLAGPKNEPHRQQHRESSHQTRCRRGERPEQEAGYYRPVDVKAVHYPSADKLHRGIGPKNAESRIPSSEAEMRNSSFSRGASTCNRSGSQPFLKINEALLAIRIMSDKLDWENLATART